MRPETPWRPGRTAGALRAILDHRLPARVGWAHVLGGMLLALFVIQVVTGILLALYYSPSAAEAWDSLRYIEDRVVAGSLVRGLHHWASTAFVLLVSCHAARTFFWAAYKGQRRWTWVTGCLLLAVVLAFGFTGYLLPWDLKAFFGTRVGVEIAATLPILGDPLAHLLRGGTEVGALTLPRFYTVHAIVLPLAAVLLLAVHLALVRRHGITPPGQRVGTESLPPDGPTFYPHQVAKDLGAALLLLLCLLGLAWWVGAPLEARADPQSSTYVPRPEWYFLGLQQLLRLFQGPLQIVGTLVLPALLATSMLVLPWVDRNPERSWRRRPVALSLGLGVAAILVVLTLWGHYELRAEETRMAQRRAAAPRPSADAAPAKPPAGADRLRRGATLYPALGCAKCHEAEGAGTGLDIPPTLRFEGSRVQRSWLVRYLQTPEPIRFASDGVRPLGRMPDFHLGDADAAAVAAHLLTQTDPALVPPAEVDWSAAPTPDTVRQGRDLVEQYQCLGCHRIGGQGAEIGPHLDGVGRRLRPDYIHALIRNPDRIVPGTAMKDSGLWDDEAEAIVRYLQTLR